MSLLDVIEEVMEAWKVDITADTDEVRTLKTQVSDNPRSIVHEETRTKFRWKLETKSPFGKLLSEAVLEHVKTECGCDCENLSAESHS